MKQGGFTIIEAVVVIAITGFMVMALGSLFVWQSSLFAVELKRVDVERAHNTTVEKISLDVREARAVVASYGGYISNTSTLVLQSPIDATTISSTEFDYIIYTFSQSAGVQRIVYTASSSNRMVETRSLNPYVITTSGVQFTYSLAPPAGSATVTIGLTSTGTIRSTNHVLTDQIILKIRN